MTSEQRMENEIMEVDPTINESVQVNVEQPVSSSTTVRSTLQHQSESEWGLRLCYNYKPLHQSFNYNNHVLNLYFYSFWPFWNWTKLNCECSIRSINRIQSQFNATEFAEEWGREAIAWESRKQTSTFTVARTKERVCRAKKPNAYT